jgi:membrane-associated phospholipid phosphatase
MMVRSKGSALLLFVAASGAALFAGIALLVLSGTAESSDARWLARIIALRSEALTPVVMQITALGNGLTVAMIAGLSVTLLLAGRRPDDALLVGSATAGGVLLQSALKPLLARPRPDAADWLAPATTMAFPSGHAVNAAAAYFALTLVVLRLPLPPTARHLLALSLVLIALLVGASRPYLGVHYPLDVAGGLAIGAAWVALCALGVRARNHAAG